MLSKLAENGQCEDCQTQVENADCFFRDDKDIILCGVCSGKCDPCQQCYSHNVVFDDFGLTLCRVCQDNMTPEQVGYVKDRAFVDDFEMGRI